MVLATSGRVAGARGNEARNKLALTVTSFKNLGSKN